MYKKKFYLGFKLQIHPPVSVPRLVMVACAPKRHPPHLNTSKYTLTGTSSCGLTRGCCACAGPLLMRQPQTSSSRGGDYRAVETPRIPVNRRTNGPSGERKAGEEGQNRGAKTLLTPGTSRGTIAAMHATQNILRKP